jgi:S1/P1 Nuclease
MNRLILGISVLVSSSTFATVPAWSWGNDGHRTVGMIADLILERSKPIHDAVKSTLDNATLSDASVFADCAKGPTVCNRPLSPDERDFVANNPGHKEFHYTDVPIQQNSYRLGTAGTRDNDAVQVMREAINILRGNSGPTPAQLTKKQALWLLAHLAGDIHQPLHVGAVYFDDVCEDQVDPNVAGAGKPNFGIGTSIVSTNGGNDMKLPGEQSFHVKFWDEGTVTGAMRLAGRSKTIENFAQFIIGHAPTPGGMHGDIDSWPSQWADDTLPLAKQAYDRVDLGEATQTEDHSHRSHCKVPVTISRDYNTFANQAALDQLGKAGQRLAALLTKIFGP